MLNKHFRSELFDDSVKVVRKHWETAARIFGSNVEIGGVVYIDDTIVPKRLDISGIFKADTDNYRKYL
jgi:hypothetical protein